MMYYFWLQIPGGDAAGEVRAVEQARTRLPDDRLQLGGECGRGGPDCARREQPARRQYTRPHIVPILQPRLPHLQVPARLSRHSFSRH